VSEVRTRIEGWGEARGGWARAVCRAVGRGMGALGAVRRFVRSARIRSQVLTRVRYGGRQFQGEVISYEDRYPELFAECARRLGVGGGGGGGGQEANTEILDARFARSRMTAVEGLSPVPCSLSPVPCPPAGGDAVRVLSFGCATGEEAFTLARYLPEAEIVGVDINAWCLRQCEARNTNGRVRFVHRLGAEFAVMADAGGFDAVFAMAVFQRTEHRTDGVAPEQTGFTFAEFEREVALLGGMLKVGGMLFLDECDFAFEQTSAAGRYEALEFAGSRVRRERPLFGRENRRVAEVYEAVRGWVKRG
jgi:2-polyprenyl-3-methyl-5-hydroxy-6-metoxy-1,4-benzoquinol methylase